MDWSTPPPPPLETLAERRQRWRSLYIIYFTMFQMSLGFSIVLTGVWPYLDKLEPGSSKEVLGVAVGMNPLGQLLFSPLLGLWANRAASPRAPIITSLLLFVVASVLYAELHLFRPHAKYWMLVARFLVGVSSANIAVARAYMSAATLVEERTRAVAAGSLAQVLGFVVGPALQAAAAPLGPGSPTDTGFLRLDMYTAAGWINAVLGVVNLLLFLPWCFKDRQIAAKEAMRAQGKQTEKEALKSMKPDLISSWTLVAAFFVLVFNFVLLETLATSLTMDQFAWSKREALEYMGVLMSAGAVVACVTFALITPLTKLFEERALLLWGGFLLTGLASVLCIPWGPGPPPLAPLPADGAGAVEAGGGCPQHTQPWCATSTVLRLDQFLLGYVFVSIGYPIGVTLIQTIFSKVLGPRPQGVWQGILTGAGCVSRALGPIFVSLVYARRGPAAAFGSTAAITFTTLIALRLLYSRLRPPPLTAPTPPEPQELQPLARKDPEQAET
ncbi:major facilitator superfamily domain-containing protein 8 [Plutella xylostella]|uniref:major facilitator superfamily domain-containing protein 8 n=1 Tax=Plutella xylostella TaxID=51655 RepID=UPI002032CB6E|nr:major facilitator superfamily domain-containing protein 8 [Plutella xylostella]